MNEIIITEEMINKAFELEFDGIEKAELVREILELREESDRQKAKFND